MKQKGWQQLKDNEKKGISMVIVLCVSAFFVAFAAAILYTAGILTAQSNLRLKEERCYQLAKSYAKVLNQELITPEEKTTVGMDFYAFANSFIENPLYAFFNEEDETGATKYHFFVSGTDLSDLSKSPIEEGYGNLRVTLVKEQAGEGLEDLKSGEIPVDPSGSYDAEINRLKNIVVRQYILTVEVTAYVDEVTYTYMTEYTREEKYELKFTHNGNNILWVPGTNNGLGSWKIDTTEGADYVFSGDENIKYEYQTDKVTYCKFVENTGTANVRETDANDIPGGGN